MTINASLKIETKKFIKKEQERLKLKKYGTFMNEANPET
jgi:hypothetical protein